MTEKRFKFEWTGAGVATIINTTTNEKILASDIVYLLNSLNDENEQLKKDNQRLIRKNKRLHRDWDKLYDLCLNKGCTEDEIIKEMER